MSLSRVPNGGMLYEGALLGAGVLGVLLWGKDVLPKSMGIISIGAASFGLCTVIWRILKRSDKRSDPDCRPIDVFYEEISSQVKELSQQDSQSGGLEAERHTVRETEKFDPIAYLGRGTKLYEIYKKRKEDLEKSGYCLLSDDDDFGLKEASTSATKVCKRMSEDPYLVFPSFKALRKKASKKKRGSRNSAK